MVLDRNRQCFGNRCHNVNYGNTTCRPQFAQKETGDPVGSSSEGPTDVEKRLQEKPEAYRREAGPDRQGPAEPP